MSDASVCARINEWRSNLDDADRRFIWTSEGWFWEFDLTFHVSLVSHTCDCLRPCYESHLDEDDVVRFKVLYDITMVTPGMPESIQEKTELLMKLDRQVIDQLSLRYHLDEICFSFRKFDEYDCYPKYNHFYIELDCFFFSWYGRPMSMDGIIRNGE